MKNIKTERAAYAAWDYELEIDHLNEMSEKGWQLIQGGCFQTKYEHDEGVVYRYQLDHNAKIENRARYIDAFREQGWEYINSTFNGWHYFRKPYDPAKPAEEYEIYSDRPSKQEMAGRLGKLMTVLAVLVGLLFVANVVSFILSPRMAMLGIIVEMLAALIITCTGAVRMRGVGYGKSSARRFPVAALIAVALTGLIWFMVFASAKQETNLQTDGGFAQMVVEVSLPDWVNISVEYEEASDLNVQLVDSKGEEVFGIGFAVASGEMKLMESMEWCEFLAPGKYVLTVRCDSETSLSVSVD